MNLILKLVTCTVAVVLASNLLTNVHFPSFFQMLATGATLAVSGYLLEWAVLRRSTFWLSLVLDFLLSATIVYLLAYFFPEAYITLGGALLIAAFLTVVEAFVHTWLLVTGRVGERTR